MLLTKRKRQVKLEVGDRLNVNEERKEEVSELESQIISLKGDLDKLKDELKKSEFHRDKLSKLYDKGIIDSDGELKE